MNTIVVMEMEFIVMVVVFWVIIFILLQTYLPLVNAIIKAQY